MPTEVHAIWRVATRTGRGDSVTAAARRIMVTVVAFPAQATVRQRARPVVEAGRVVQAQQVVVPAELAVVEVAVPAVVAVAAKQPCPL